MGIILSGMLAIFTSFFFLFLSVMITLGKVQKGAHYLVETHDKNKTTGYKTKGYGGYVTSDGTGSTKDWDFCSKSSCKEDEGDCDWDDQCRPGLKCGFDNCKEIHGKKADSDADCCYNPSKPSQTGPGVGSRDDWAFCSPYGCSHGQGDCDYDSDCKAGLYCGVDNCYKIHGKKADPDADCCVKPPSDKQLMGSRADWDFCSSSRRCSENQGDCDSDSDCKAGLKCGVNNCREIHGDQVDDRWRLLMEDTEEADCCYKPTGTSPGYKTGA